MCVLTGSSVREDGTLEWRYDRLFFAFLFWHVQDEKLFLLQQTEAL